MKIEIGEPQKIVRFAKLSEVETSRSSIAIEELRKILIASGGIPAWAYKKHGF